MSKVAMVSGGGRGLGAAIVRELLADGWTLSVGLRDLTQADQFEVPDDKLMAERFEATAPDTAARWVAATVDRFGRLDALVNNAGWDMFVPFMSTAPDDWARLIDINLVGALHMHHAVLPAMIERGNGRFVNVS